MSTQTPEATRMGKMQSEVSIPSSAQPQTAGNGAAVAEQTMKDIRSRLDAQLQSAYEEFLATPQTQVAEPRDWWDLYAYGPVQPGASPGTTFAGPLLPHQVIRVGERAYVATVLLLNPRFPGTAPSAAEILSNFALPYEVQYHTGELTRWQPAGASLQHTSTGNLVPGRPWALDVFPFTAQEEGLFEMNIRARIFGCDRNIAPPFAGYATRIIDIDRDMFNVGPRVKTEEKIRFQIYR